MIRKPLQSTHYISEINRVKDAGRISQNKPLLAHVCLLKMQGFGVGQFCTVKRFLTEIYAISTKMPL